MSQTAPPSLFGNNPPPTATLDNSRQANSLLDLMYDGFYMLFLLRHNHSPTDAAAFAIKIQRFLDEVERGAKKLDVSTEDVFNAKYAFCAVADEIVLASQASIRDVWERRPLQLLMFGEQLAGENFFIRLEQLRQQGPSHIQALEVFHMCLLSGFQGKYVIDGPEKLAYLTSRLGDEIAHMKGKRGGFAPHWQRPDQIAHSLKREVPLWVMGSVFALLALLAFTGLKWSLGRSTESKLSAYNNLVKLAPAAANLTITLP
jgi:type VI secretion system protein ImpK